MIQSHGAVCVVRLAHGVEVDAQAVGRGAERELDLGQRREGVETSLSGEHEGPVEVEGGVGAAHCDKGPVGVGPRHELPVLNLEICARTTECVTKLHF